MKNLIYVIALLTAFSGFGQTPGKKFNVQKTDKEWKAQLTKEEYEVLRNKGTERAFTGKYWNTFEKGKYVCAACGQVIFNSNSKFKSDCGWPSFDQAIKGSVIYQHDNSFGMDRTEVLCANCGSHLGHVFDDGPAATTGKRFCTNSVSIKFIPAKK
ncbi:MULTISPECIES: peptide-methionine (R)-S-oxide reductase MsrB [Flavobacterium]|uniref:peptide-methionine (R)-S-oxide reductase MsrB n=1 Tax=Flavobacterium TaxID=237 RepID=UPI00095FE85E|nr:MULTISPECIES: peptide-methionine (R)-S-oxide reductase MsrB [Flavobacterium]MBN9285537.1 peptide-methionine (R)-S-oxide reductase MsrB [Flavobacterium sp.]OJV71523.1 MAG: peptide-methionine (R)-S-oxide reductase [Flavobacterium sp. 40-81]